MDYLSNSALWDYIRRNPRLAAQFTPSRNLDEDMRAYYAPDADRIAFGQTLQEAGALGDPFGVTALQRLLGFDVPPMVLLGEAHGLSKEERNRQRDLDKAKKKKAE